MKDGINLQLQFVLQLRKSQEKILVVLEFKGIFSLFNLLPFTIELLNFKGILHKSH